MFQVVEMGKKSQYKRDDRGGESSQGSRNGGLRTEEASK